MHSSPTPPAHAVISSIQRSTHLIAAYLERAVPGLGQADAHVLAALADAGSRTVAELHHDFGHKRSTLTSILDRLETRGLVTREIEPTDRRSVRIRLTSRGAHTARRVAGAFRRVEVRVGRATSETARRGFWATLEGLERSLR